MFKIGSMLFCQIKTLAHDFGIGCQGIFILNGDVSVNPPPIVVISYQLHRHLQETHCGYIEI
jgi:hypothetical protein